MLNYKTASQTTLISFYFTTLVSFKAKNMQFVLFAVLVTSRRFLNAESGFCLLFIIFLLIILFLKYYTAPSKLNRLPCRLLDIDIAPSLECYFPEQNTEGKKLYESLH